MLPWFHFEWLLKVAGKKNDRIGPRQREQKVVVNTRIRVAAEAAF